MRFADFQPIPFHISLSIIAFASEAENLYFLQLNDLRAVKRRGVEWDAINLGAGFDGFRSALPILREDCFSEFTLFFLVGVAEQIGESIKFLTGERRRLASTGCVIVG